MESSYCLIAGLPPGNVSSDEGRVQSELFRVLGLPSVRALPPLVPFAWVAEAVEVATIADDVIPRRPIFGDYRCEGNVLIRDVTWVSGSQNALAQALPRAFSPSPFPADDVLVVAPGVDCSNLDNVPSLAEAGRPRGVKVYRLVCMVVEWITESTDFWGATYQVLSERWVQ